MYILQRGGGEGGGGGVRRGSLTGEFDGGVSLYMSKSVLPFYNNTIRKESVRLGLLRQGFKRGFLVCTLEEFVHWRSLYIGGVCTLEEFGQSPP